MKINRPVFAAFLILLLYGCGGAGTAQPFFAASSISAGDFHTCATLTDKTVRCWGLNTSGQLGNGSILNFFRPSTSVSGITSAIQVSAGGTHTCAVLTGGSVSCWGGNTFGQLGNGTSSSISTTPVGVTSIAGVASVSAGGNHTCAVLTDGTIRCWGKNVFGELGDTTNNNSSTPATVSGINNASAVSAGGDHTCALLNDGTVKCWGSNSFGQLGNGNQAVIRSSTPVSVITSAPVTQIAAGANHTCALLSNGSVQCWGDNSSGQLGIQWTPVATIPPSFVTDSFSPVFAGVSGTISSITAGLSHTCALMSNNVIQCWGSGGNGQLGNGTLIGLNPPGPGSTAATFSPVLVNGLTNGKQVDAGLLHTCALLSNSQIKCWGLNSSGQLGNGTNVDSATPTQVVE